MNNTVPPESEFLLLTFFFFFDVDDRRPLQKSSPGPHRPPETDHCTSADQTLDWCELQPLGCGVGVQPVNQLRKTDLQRTAGFFRRFFRKRNKKPNQENKLASVFVLKVAAVSGGKLTKCERKCL